MWTTNKKSLVCLIAGAVVVIVVVTLAAVAIAKAKKLHHAESGPAIDFTIMEKSVPTKPGSLAKRRGFIIEQSGSEGVRIFATVNTGRPTPVSQEQLEKERSKSTTNEEVAVKYQLPAPMKSESLNSLENLQALAENIRDNKTSIPSLFDVFSQYFDGVTNKPDDNDVNEDSPPDWLTLTYLGASIFLLKQMDTLYKFQSSPNSRQFQSRALTEQPWDFNSLNLLFVEPGNDTDVQSVVKNGAIPPNLNEYLWAAHNIYTTAQDPDSIQCIWSAYCDEINNRAPMQGIAGAMARLNGVVMEMMSGSLSPSAALAKLSRSILHRTRLDCAALFPACPPEAAAEYLIHLATTPLAL